MVLLNADITPLVSNPLGIFLILLLIILVTPIVFNRFKIPHIIGLIIAGMAVGPYGFNILARDASFELFGQVGLLYLMFLAGIEIDMFNLRRNLRRGITFGLLTFAIPLFLGIIVCRYALGMGMLASLLVSSMFCAHTLIAYPIISRFGLQKQQSVVIAVAATIFTVIGSLLVLAGVTGIKRVGYLEPALVLRILGGLCVYCIAVVYLFPRITRWFFKRYSDPILQFVYILAMAFLAAQGAVWAGVESVFGAFFGGLVLSRYVPARSPLMVRLEFVGNALFIPFFLIGVGMLINIGVIRTDTSSIVYAVAMSVTAMAGKWCAAFVAQKLFKFRSVERSILYQLTNAHTAVALAVVTIGFNMGILNETILNATVLMILATCTVSSIGTEHAAAKLKTRMLTQEAVSGGGAEKKSHTRTLIPVANPVTARELVDLAILMRGRVVPGSMMYALHVRNENTPLARSVSRSSLDTAISSAAAVDEEVTPLERYDLNFVTGVINVMAERDITELIIGLHRRNNFIDSFFGDKVEQLLKATNRMVVISRFLIPVNTLRRVVVMVPRKAEFETGFIRWVTQLGNLAQQLGCRIIFCAHPATQPFIKSVIAGAKLGIRHEYRPVEQYDDFILLANRILDDDLLVVVNARRSSVSFSADMDNIPTFLQRYFAANNLVVIYPEQFGDEPLPTSAETLSTDLAAVPSPLYLKVNALLRKLSGLKHRNRKKRIDL